MVEEETNISTIACVFLETGQGSPRQSRENIASALGIDREDCSGDLPLLYYVVAAFQNKDKVDD